MNEKNINKQTNKPIIDINNEHRHFSAMRIIDGYVLREFILVFTVMIFAFTLLFIIIDTYTELSDFTNENNNIPIRVILLYFILKLPSNISFVFPITILLSSMYTFAMFGKHREITAMRASGISILRCGIPILFVSALVTALDYYFIEKIIPSTTAQATFIKQNIDHIEEILNENKLHQSYTSLQFHSGDRLRTWYFSKFETKDSIFSDKNEDYNIIGKDVRIQFFKYNSDSNQGSGKYVPLYRIYADEVSYEKNQQTQKSQWILHNAYRRNYDTKEGHVLLDYLPYKEENIEKIERYILDDDEITETPTIIMKAIVDPELLSSLEILDLLKNNWKMPHSLRNVYQTIFYHRLSFPLSCFICALIALPLGSKNERSGIFLVITTAVGIAVLYQLVDQIAFILGKHGVFPQITLLPTIGFFLYGCFLAWKSR